MNYRPDKDPLECSPALEITVSGGRAVTNDQQRVAPPAQPARRGGQMLSE